MTLASPASVLRQLIRCPSVTPDVGGCFDLLQTWLAALGFSIERPRFSAAGTPGVENFYAKRPAEGGKSKAKSANARKIGVAARADETANAPKHLMFAGHCDTVPAGAAAWRFPPFSGQEADGFIFGRGAVDMKGGIACFIAALARLHAAGAPLGGAVSLLISGDEEGPAINGTAKLLDWAEQKGEHWDAALLGEPSSAARLGDMIKIGRRGSLSAVLTVEGKQGHVAYPQLAANPLPLLLHLGQALLLPKLDKGTADFPPSNLELTSIDAGNAAVNIIPARAEMRFNIRFNDGWDLQSLQAELEKRLQKAAQAAGSQARYRLDFAANPSSPFITREAALLHGLEAAIAAITGQKPQLSTGGGTSDARFIKNYCPVVEFGLVGETMHQADERAALADLEQLTQIYQLFIQNFFAAG